MILILLNTLGSFALLSYITGVFMGILIGIFFILTIMLNFKK